MKPTSVIMSSWMRIMTIKELLKLKMVLIFKLQFGKVPASMLNDTHLNVINSKLRK